MEDMGYDMSEYRNPEPVLGNVSKEEYEAIKREALAGDRSMRTAGSDLANSKQMAEDCEKAMAEHHGSGEAEYDPETGYGGYGDEFTLDGLFQFVEDSGGWAEFDYLS
jgi:hypothetical protein